MAPQCDCAIKNQKQEDVNQNQEALMDALWLCDWVYREEKL